MNRHIQALKEKAESLNLKFRDDDWEETSFLDWLIKGKSTRNTTVKEFEEWLTSNYNFRWVKTNAADLPDYDDWRQGSEEYGYTVIQINGTYYKLEYKVGSYGGVECADYWDWKEATPVKREFTFYE